MANATREIFDYVIVGAGSAGCLLAHRLSQQGKLRVCVLEAGPHDRNPLIHIPAGYIKNVYSRRLTWGFKAEPSPGTAGRSVDLPQGKVLGGSSSINGLNYNRGQAADFDSWANMGNTGWSYSDVLPYFKRSERRVGSGDDAFRGREGELPVTDIDWRHPLCEQFIEGAALLGIARNPDYNGSEQAGAGYYQRAIEHGWRVSSAKAFLRLAVGTGRVDVRTSSQVEQIVFEDRRAVGVRYVIGGRRGEQREVRAEKEVILCAGTINSARLLQVSGIGPKSLLDAIGACPVHPLPGVGSNLRDHYAVRVVARAKNAMTINNLARGLPLMGQILRWMVGRPSILAVSPSHAYAFWKSDEALDNPDLQFTFTPASFREGVVGLLDRIPGMTCGVWQQRPESSGFVRATSVSTFDAPIIQPNYLSHEIDRRALIGGIRLARRLLTSPALLPNFDSEISPGAGVESDDELLDFAKRLGTTVYHLIGSNKMGPDNDPLAVVDPQLRVRGVFGLRVADASVMPTVPSANTNAATMMIAEKASDMILGRVPLTAG